MPARAGKLLVFPAGFTGGLLQGASGISMPVSVSFLNALCLDRRTFIAIISVFFSVMSACQIPALAWFGLVTTHSIALSLFAVLPILLFMPVGSMAAERFSKPAFDKVILFLLVGLAIKLLVDAVAYRGVAF
ncbi:TSUP family transporter [Aurantimonas aggregata]|uniref:Probable membrane transporter protein n=1 Tax=Aurantimonas aggregata TaxID=2047720 RepID=A0A6L9MNV0_9HYPH|nr:TSUP family transporter [Aurantimonas aggregata]NDV89190.1 TSUP family transporter [Aurantimonas aggregata]